MKKNRPVYTGRDLALVIPTKDRPEKIHTLLESTKRQSIRCGRIIVVDGGMSVKDIVLSFGDSLPVEYFACNPPGQIRQRNVGIAQLDNNTPLVGFLDDDVVLEKGALENMIAFWNRADVHTAGVGFNITNINSPSHSLLRTLMLLGTPVPGKILLSGVNMNYFNIPDDIRTQFLGGGYTIWKRSILDEFPQENLNTRWAWGEDVRYSYPIGKKYPLYVCASAKVHHEHVYDQAPPDFVHRYQGRKGALAIFYFVRSNPELSRLACLWMLTTSAIANFVYGIVTLNPSLLKFALGRAEGILICLKGMLGFTDIRKEMED
ncbi:MAG: glycosyltransferase [Syntrophales bacterium]|jgi:glycosyltransferase involved in cell wall biosynthesis